MNQSAVRSIARTLVIGVALAALASCVTGCGMTQPPVPDDPGTVVVTPKPPAAPKPPMFTPADQCLIAQTSYNGASVGLDFVKVDSPQAQAGIDAGLAAVQSAADQVCAAAAQGQSPKAVTTLFSAFNSALADFHASMQAIKRAKAGLPPGL